MVRTVFKQRHGDRFGLRRFELWVGDYSHGFHYEELFCPDPQELSPLVSRLLCLGGEVLDLAGGSGRLAAALARRGKKVTLVDRSKTMLLSGAEKRLKLPAAAQALWEQHAVDLREMDFPRSFQQIVCVRNGLEHLNTESEIVEVLIRVRRHLAEGGIFLFEVHNLPFWEKKGTGKKIIGFFCGWGI